MQLGRPNSESGAEGVKEVSAILTFRGEFIC